MRIFRTEEAARKAGYAAISHNDGFGLTPGDRCRILTARERALLEALEKVLPGSRQNADEISIAFGKYAEYDDEIAAIEAAEALIKSLNVEG